MVNIKFMKSEVTVNINVKRLNHNHSSRRLVGRHLAFSVTTKSNIPWVAFVFPILALAGYNTVHLFIIQHLRNGIV
jgi:hypothetical protein